MLDISRLKRSTHQGYVSKGLLLPGDTRGASRADLFELIIVMEIRDVLSVDELARRWKKLRDEGTAGEFLTRAEAAVDSHSVTDGNSADDSGHRFDVMVELTHPKIQVATTDAELSSFARGRGFGHPLVVLDLLPRLVDVDEAFDGLAVDHTAPPRRAGRPARKANVASLRSV